MIILSSDRNHRKFQEWIRFLLSAGTAINKELNTTHGSIRDRKLPILISQGLEIGPLNAGGDIDYRRIGIVQHNSADGSIGWVPWSDSGGYKAGGRAREPGKGSRNYIVVDAF